MKFNKIIAAMSAVTMLGSMAIAVPASAEEATLTLPAKGISYTVQGLEEGASSFTAINSAREQFNQAGKTFTFKVKGAPFTANSKTYTKAKVATAEEAIDGTIKLGNTKSVYIPFGGNYAVTSLEVTGNSKAYIVALVKADEYTDANLNVENDSADPLPIFSSNMWFRANDPSRMLIADGYTRTKADDNLTNTVTLNEGKSPIKYSGIFIDNNNSTGIEVNSITVKYDPDVADPVAKIGSTEYATFSAAYAAANDGDEIVLLDDVSFDARVTLGKAVTIKGDGQTITSKADILVTKNVTIDGVNVTTASQAKLDADNITVTVKNATVTGGIYLGKVNGTVVFDTVNVDKVTTRSGDKKDDKKNTVQGTANIGELVYYSATDVIDTGLTVTTLTDAYVAPEPQTHSEYFSFAGDESVSYNAIELTASNGTDEQTRMAPIMTITGASEIAAEVANIPEGITITGIVLTSVAAN